MIELTKTEKINMNITDIAKKVKEQLIQKYPECVFSVTIERYSMGQSLHIALMKADFRVIRNFEDIPEIAFSKIGSGYTKEDIQQRQKEKYHQLNPYQLRQNYNTEVWCNGVFLTEQGHNLLKDAVKIADQYNYDNSDLQTDYFDVNFHLDVDLGKWNKDFIQETE